MAGYSGTPLPKKLGIVAGGEVWAINAPAHYRELLDELPDGVQFVSALSSSTDLVHLFTTSAQELHEKLEEMRFVLKPNGIVWISWPKKASKVPTDITEDTIRDVCLPMGYVDVKVCAVDDVWSGLKLVIRKELR